MSEITYYEIVKTRSLLQELCPKCREAAFPQGAFLATPVFKIQTMIKLWLVKVPINLCFAVQYCPKCGFLALREIKI